MLEREFFSDFETEEKSEKEIKDEVRRAKMRVYEQIFGVGKVGKGFLIIVVMKNIDHEFVVIAMDGAYVCGCFFDGIKDIYLVIGERFYGNGLLSFRRFVGKDCA